MGLSQIIDPFYRELTREEWNDRPITGQICLIPGIFPDHVPQVIEVHRHDARDHTTADFIIRNLTENDFGRKDTLPIKKLNIRAGEELLAVRSKRRPAILLKPETFISNTVAKQLPSMGKKHLQERDTFLALPMFSTQTEEYGSGVPPIMVARIKPLMYPQYFYLPQCTRFSQKESMVRFDRAQIIVSRDPAVLKPLNYSLTDEVLEVLFAHLMSWLRLPMNSKSREGYDAILDLLAETLPDSIRDEERL
jgi:hypothetical protein